MYNQVLEVEQFPTQEPSFTRVKNLIVYDVNDLIKEIPVTEGPPLETPDLNDFPVNDVIKGPRGPISTSSVTSSNVTLPGPYNLALYKCNTVLNQCGTLYKRSDTAQVNKFMFDFAKDVAISVIATTITIVFSAKIVAVGVLLSQLGVQFSNLMLKDSLTGYYSATRYRYSYYVMVKSKTTYRHNQVQYNVRYYNQKNRKELTRVVRSPSWMSENAILNVGILAY